jgi:glycosyltransferase involved in cell wall biosynthesis
VESALCQTFRAIEVIVVPAQPCEETRIALLKTGDARLRVLPFDGALDPAAARNRGVQSAHGDWVAFLDDDDCWLPDKLRRQLETAARSNCRRPVVSCGMLVRDGNSERLWPRRLPKGGETPGDYLFRRRGLLGAAGYLQTSTLLAPRALLLEIPFRPIHPGEDLDWVLRAVLHGNAQVEFVTNAAGRLPEPLIVWNISVGRPRESLRHQWRNSLDWIRENRDLVGPEAYASFLLTWVSLEAARQQAGIRGFWELLRVAVRHGRPSMLDLVVHLGHWLIPFSTLHHLSGRFTGRVLTAESAPE